MTGKDQVTLFGPVTREDRKTWLADHDWFFVETGRCRGKDCRAEIQWWAQDSKKWMPLDPVTLERHHKTCPNVADFRKAKV